MRSRTIPGLLLMIAACTNTSSSVTGLESGAASVAESGEGEATGDEGACSPNVASIQTEIFVPRCAGDGCHETHAPAAGLDLQSDAVTDRLVGVQSATCDGVLVTPGDAASSVLFTKLAEMPACGVQMPPAASLEATSVTCIRAWIDGLEQTCETCDTDVCIDQASDSAHCGGCNQPCPPTASCMDGECRCPNGLVPCGSSCVNPQTNPNHCGECDAACSEGEVCNAGACADDCGVLEECDGACVDLNRDPEHCGRCNAACGMATTCNAGSCGCMGDFKSYAADVESIMVAHCTNMGCHRPPNPSAGLDLRAGIGYGALVDVPSEQCAQRLLVAPAEPGASYLLDKLLNQNLCAGTRMPKSSPLPAADIETVSDWICSGANP